MCTPFFNQVEIFEKIQVYGAAGFRSRSQLLNDYVTSVVSDIKEWLVKGLVSQIIIAIISKGKLLCIGIIHFEKLMFVEQYVLELDVITRSHNISVLELHSEFRNFILRLQNSVIYLNPQ